MRPIRVLCVGAGHMGLSHARAYRDLPDFEIVGICTRTPASSQRLCEVLELDLPRFDRFEHALASTRPDAVSISSYTDSHYPYAKLAMQQGCHVFVEKPLAENLVQAQELVALARQTQRKIVVGYILRHHPAWGKFVEIARTLGKPLVMRLNLNQQSSGENWRTHKNLLASASPIVDCGVHYVDIMCQMTRSRPVRVSGISARLANDIAAGQVNYGQLQVTFEDGSVGWYEAGWGPMMSETAYFIKDVIGPRGSVSIRADKASSQGNSSNVDAHTQTEALLVHQAELDASGRFKHADERIQCKDEPTHDELCRREQAYFARAIRENLDLTDHLDDVIHSMRIVLAADESARKGTTIALP